MTTTFKQFLLERHAGVVASFNMWYHNGVDDLEDPSDLTSFQIHVLVPDDSYISMIQSAFEHPPLEDLTMTNTSANGYIAFKRFLPPEYKQSRHGTVGIHGLVQEAEDDVHGPFWAWDGPNGFQAALIKWLSVEAPGVDLIDELMAASLRDDD